MVLLSDVDVDMMMELVAEGDANSVDTSGTTSDVTTDAPSYLSGAVVPTDDDGDAFISTVSKQSCFDGSFLLGVRLLALLMALIVNIDENLVGTTEDKIEEEVPPFEDSSLGDPAVDPVVV